MDASAGNNNIEDFLNPKSMPTPAAAGAIVALISGALFKNFGISVAFCTIALSFMLGMVVFQSREFKSEKSSKFVKLILYIINSLIIFSMATGTTSVMAEDMINQERPLFYDWTKSSADLQHRDSETSDSNYEIKVEITKSQKPGLKSWLQNQGVITKSYETKLSLVTKNEDPDAQPKNIKFFLPKNEFKVDKISLTPRQVKQGINIKAWKSFPVEAEITTETGKNIKIYKYVNPEKIIKGSQ